MLHDAKGNRLFKTVKVKIVFPDNVLPVKNITKHAPPKQGFGGQAVDDLLEQIADQLDQLYPFWEFKLIETVPQGKTAYFTFRFECYRAPAEPVVPADPDQIVPARQQGQTAALEAASAAAPTI